MPAGRASPRPPPGTARPRSPPGCSPRSPRRGLPVAPFKVGPDYIDPGYHALAAGPARAATSTRCMVGEELIGPLFAHGSAGRRPRRRRGRDGPLRRAHRRRRHRFHRAGRRRCSTRRCILVVDAAAQGRSVAALVHGFRSFGNVRLAGVILNRVGSDRHESILREACEEVGTPVLGALRRADAVAAPVAAPRSGARPPNAAPRPSRRSPRWPRWSRPRSTSTRCSRWPVPRRRWRRHRGPRRPRCRCRAVRWSRSPVVRLSPSRTPRRPNCSPAPAPRS